MTKSKYALGLSNSDIWNGAVYETFSKSGNNETAESQTSSQLRRQMHLAPALFYTRAPITPSDIQQAKKKQTEMHLPR